MIPACLHILLLTCFIFVLLFSGSEDKIYASTVDEFLSGFKQTVYNQDNGLGSAEVNCIYQTASGYIWIGTDGGLYRFNGKEFKIFNLWNTDKDDVYFVNNLFQDSRGRLWVCTGNYGLFYIQGSSVTHFTDDYYNGVKCINAVCETPDGTIYVAATTGLYTVNENGTGLTSVDSLAGKNVRALTLAGKNLWGIVGGNGFFKLSDAGNIISLKAASYTQEELSCILGKEDGTVYLGTPGTEILHVNALYRSTSFVSGKDGINSLYHDGERLFVCADSGAGYFEKDGSFHALYDTEVNRYITCMIMDYEGDYWFASSRMGVLLLGRSKFRNFNELYGITGTATNCILNVGNRAYVGTDEGLTVVLRDDMTVMEHELSDYLNGASVRDVMQDSLGNLWVSTSRRFGVVKYGRNGKITTIGRSNGLPTNQVNRTKELSDGSIAVLTEEGIVLFDQEGQVLRAYTASEGLDYPDILCLYEAEDGRLFAGSDGGGLYVIKGDNIRKYTDEDGLTSNVISDIIPGKNGIWIGTDNGLSIFTEGIRAVSNIDFSNNIYNLLSTEEEDGKLRIWIIGSKGVISATEEELLGTGQLTGRYLAQGDGLDLKLSLGCRCSITEDILYLCCTKGILMLKTGNISINDVAPKLTVSEINVDDTVYHLDQLGGSLAIPADTQRLSIAFAVLSYTNRENVVVEYKLEGFDQAPIKITPADPMQAVYTNLDGGTYTFTVGAVNGDGIASTQNITFTIVKEFGFMERQSTKILFIGGGVLFLFILFLSIFLLQKRMRGQNREIEKLEKEHEVAVKSSTAKTDFLAHISNEIKIPVNAIISLAETMQKEQNEEVRREGLQAIASSGQDILGKVDETIELARLESGKITAASLPYSVTTLVCDISDQMIKTLDQKPVRFLVDLGDNIPDIVIGDFDKLHRVLEILLDNAAKYTREGTITLFVDYYENSEQPDKARMIFNVSDTGVGIQEERLEHIFEVYNIADNKRQTGYSGSGISLAIAKQLTEIMKGEIEVESTYGAGSTFTVTLPLEKAKQGAVAASSYGDSDQRISREEAERMIAPTVSVLLVDDVEISRTVAQNVLRQMEMKTDVADSGVSALDLVMNHDYDLIFMDLNMPVMDGMDTMREIRELAREGAEDLPIIAMTEDALSEDEEGLLAAGFTDLIVKPLEISTLAMILRNLVPEKVEYREKEIETYTEEVRGRVELAILERQLDVTGVLEKIGGSVEVYNRILSTFYSQNQEAAEELTGKFDSNYRSFCSRIHNIRSGAQNIGATDLQTCVQRIDSAINIGNRSFVEENLPVLIERLSDVLEAIREYLDQTSGETGELKARPERKDERTDEGNVGAGTKSKEENEENGSSEKRRIGVRKKPEKVKEKAKENKKEVQKIKTQIDFEILDIMMNAVNAKDEELLRESLGRINEESYAAEDTEFVEVLSENVESGNLAAVTDLIETYKELKR